MTYPLVRFLADDPMGLWQANDLADDLGPESPATPQLRLLRLLWSGELVTLTSPFERNLVERVEPGTKVPPEGERAERPGLS